MDAFSPIPLLLDSICITIIVSSSCQHTIDFSFCYIKFLGLMLIPYENKQLVNRQAQLRAAAKTAILKLIEHIKMYDYLRHHNC